MIDFMLTIISEKQTGHTRLLILNGIPELKYEKAVSVDGAVYPMITVHGLKQAVAISCKESEPSMIGKNVEFM